MALRLSAIRAGRPLPPRKIPDTHFCQRLSRSQGHSAAGRIRSISKSNDLIGIRTRDLPVCSIVPQSTTLTCVPVNYKCRPNVCRKFKIKCSIFLTLLLILLFFIGLFCTSLFFSFYSFSRYNWPSSQLFCQLPPPETKLDSVSLLRSSYPGKLASQNSTNSNDRLRPFYNPTTRTTQKTQPLYC
jgi:hypothetical protein